MRNRRGTTSSISVSRGRAQDKQVRSSAEARACGHLRGKLPPPKWPQAQITAMNGRAFRGDQEPCVRVLRLTRTGTNEIFGKVALQFLSLDGLCQSFQRGRYSVVILLVRDMLYRIPQLQICSFQASGSSSPCRTAELPRRAFPERWGRSRLQAARSYRVRGNAANTASTFPSGR